MIENRLLLASSNPGKVRELTRLLASAGVEVFGLDDIPEGGLRAPEETGDTFCENALIKAQAWCVRSRMATLADDSGLAVDALDGEPGVRSARYAGTDATDEDNNELLLRRLQGVRAEDRTAAFHCCLVLCRPSAEPVKFTGRADGSILTEPAGDGGFGYDPLFYYPPLDSTFAQLDHETKNRVSHRANALRKFIRWLEYHPLDD